jgi:hypothetical protein
MADPIQTAQYYKVQIAGKLGKFVGILAPLREGVAKDACLTN